MLGKILIAEGGQKQPRRLMMSHGKTDAARGDLVANSRLLLVDDVMTTGATAHEASLAALNAGAREVRVFCVARAM